jgi:hypothetical protein
MMTGRITYLADPPRRVPFSVVAAAIPGTIGMLGAIFFLFGMLFVVIFSGDVRPLDELRLSSAMTTTAMATVTDVRETNSTENDVSVYEYRFTFRMPDETNVSGKSYSTGQIWSKGDRVPVTYLSDKPGVAQLQDTRHTEFPWWAMLLVGIFPFVGGVMLIAGTLGGWRQIRLLMMGRLAYARWINVTPTNTTINSQPVMKYTFEFQAEDGQSYQGNSKSLPKAQLGDEANEPVLYWPTNPDRSMLLDAVPVRYALSVDGSGQWVSDGNLWPILWSGLIGLGVLGCLIFVITRFL